jgi:hypothetical protein
VRAALATSGAVALGLVVLYPVALWLTGTPFPKTQYVVGQEVRLYQYLASQPKDIVIASLSYQADLLPSFARRSILSGYEYGIPYHEGYYFQIRRRTQDLVRAQYSLDPAEVRRFIDTYGVKFWLLDEGAFRKEYLALHAWINQTQPDGSEARDNLNRLGQPVVERLAERCLAYRGNRVELVDATCMRQQLGG